MVVSQKSIVSTPEILKRKLGGELLVPITIASDSFTNGICKAGTPIGAGGVVATDTTDEETEVTTNNAIGILLNDVYSKNPNGSLIKAFASINTAKAQSHSGVTYSATLKQTLADIKFE